MVSSNRQAMGSSVAMAVPNGSGFSMGTDFRAANERTEQAAMPMPRLEELGILIRRAAAFRTLDIIFRTLDIIQTFRPKSSHESAQDLFTMVNNGGTCVHVDEGATTSLSMLMSPLTSRQPWRRC